MSYKALTYVMVGEEKKAPGDVIEASEFYDAGQEDENIEQLVEMGAISEDLDAEVHPDHREVEIEVVTGSDNHVVAGDNAKGGDTNE